MRLESGPAKGDAIYFTFVCAICVGLFGWFLYDWQIGYPKANLKKAVGELSTLLSKEASEVRPIVDKLPPTPTEPDFEKVEETVKQATREAKLVSAEEVFQELGDPIHRQALGTGAAASNYYAYIASQFGVATVLVRNGNIAVVANRDGQLQPERLIWQTWGKSRAQVQRQAYFSLIPLILALYFLPRMIRAYTLKASIDDEGMTYGGKRIAFADMTALRDYSPKGWIDLYHTAGGPERKLRIDNQKIAKFDEIIEIICQEKGFTNLAKAYAEERAREADADDDNENDADSTGATPV